MKQTPLEKKVTDLIAPVVESTGLRLVCARMTGDSGQAVLQVLAENRATRNLGLEECTKLSREISALLDVEDPIQGPYRLEISSPGIDRLLVSAEDFNDFSGFEAKIEMEKPQENGQKKFRGLLRGVEEGAVKLETEDQGPVSLPLAGIGKARLVLTDDLIKSTKPKTATEVN